MAKKNRKAARLKRVQQRQLKRAQAAVSKRILAPPVTPPPAAPTKPASQLEQINDTLSFIHSNDNLNSSQELSNKILEAIALETGQWDIDLTIQVNRDTDLYEIDKSWSGNPNTLINHIKFKQDLINPEARSSLDDVITSDWGSQELYDEHLEKAKAQAYQTNIKGIQKKLDVIPNKMLGTLEQIMNSSQMWHIIADKHGLRTQGSKYTDSLDSKQSKTEWLEMHKDVRSLLTAKGISQKELDKLVDMILNAPDKETVSESYYNKVIDYVDELLEKYVD